MRKIKENWHILVFILMSSTPVLWFAGRGDILINGLDTNFPLNPWIWLQRRFFVWNDVLNGGVDFSSSMSGFFFHLVQTVPFLLGFNLKAVEIISIVFWFSCVVFSSYFFSSSLINKSKMASVVFVVFYTFNTYVFNTWENVKVSNIALLVGLPLFLGLVHRYIHKNLSLKILLGVSIVSSIITSGSGINPAYFMTIVLAVILYSLINVIFNPKNISKILKVNGVVLGIFFLVNLYWILPLFNFLFFTQKVGSLQDIGLTDWLNSLSANTSLVNVLRLQGAWDWYAADPYGAPLYIPYSVKYFTHPIFIIFSFTFAILSLLSLIFIDKSKKVIYSFFAIILLVGVFLAAGTHNPTGVLYIFLTKHLPFFSFFRSPWYIFTPLIVLSFSAFIALFYNNLSQFKKYNRVLNGLAVIYILGNFLYCYPLLTGKIFRPNRHDSFYVNFPSYVWEAGDYLADQPIYPRVLTYPDDQLENFTWGYKGTESILGLISKQEVMTPSFNNAQSGLQSIMDSIYLNIKKQNYLGAINQMAFLGVDTILNKKDTISLSEKINENDVNLVSHTNNKVFQDWSFIETKNKLPNKIYSTADIYRNLSGTDTFAALSAILPTSSLVVNANDSEANKIPGINQTPVITRASQKIEDIDITSDSQIYEVSVPTDSDYSIYIDDKGIGAANISIIIDEKEELRSSQQENGFILFKDIKLTAGAHKIAVNYPQTTNIISPTNFTQQNSKVNLRGEALPDNLATTLVAYNNTTKDVGYTIPTHAFNPYVKYLVSLDTKYYYGSVPQLELIQSAPMAPVKVQTKSISDSGDWENLSIVYEPVHTNSKMELRVSVSANHRTNSKSFIQNISMRQIYDNQVYLVETPKKLADVDEANINMQMHNPTYYSAKVSNAENGFIVVFNEAYSPHWKLQAQGTAGFPIHMSINNWANAWYIPPGMDSYEITISYTPQRLVFFGVAVMIVGLSGLIYLIVLSKKIK